MSRVTYEHHRICVLYTNGKTIEDIAIYYDANVVTIKRVLKSRSVGLRPDDISAAPVWTKERREAQRKRVPSAKGLRYKHTYRCQRPNARGEKNPQWKGGKTELNKAIRTCAKYRWWRQRVYIDAKHACALCGIKPNSDNQIVLHCDHIVPLSRLIHQYQLDTIEAAEACDALWDTQNGRILCEQCHRNTPTFGLNLCHSH